METWVSFAVGTVVGLTFGLTVGLYLAKQAKESAQSIFDEREKRAREDMDRMVASMKESFGALSLEALSKNTEEFLKVAGETLNKHTETNKQELGGKKEMIDQTLKNMKGELDKVNDMVQGIEKDRKAKFDVLSKEISRTADETKSLRETTHDLTNALTNSRVRGQWGERMAEDVLRLAGFIEGTNYLKQQTLTKGDGSRPDFTFYLPDNHFVHMDVKFPLENYLNHMNAKNDNEREKYKTQFLKDARTSINETTKRGYIDKSQGTLDYVLVFIPNEQVYSFLNEHDHDLVDNSLRQKIVLCSPTTLYAVLSVIRQAVDNFHMERKASDILKVLEDFSAQWDSFKEAMDKMGRRIDDSQREFQKLTGTRQRALEKPLKKIEELKANEHMVETKSGAPLKVITNENDIAN
ncbi:MAG: DNA recombination protein RmuC [Alphaproteobacteria bacterium]|jgi:DNA recombination protein RmuC